MSSLWVRSLCLVGLSVGWAWGSTTCVQFDVAETVSCRPLELHGQPVAVSAGEMLVEATFEVSSLIHLARRRAAATAVRLGESPADGSGRGLRPQDPDGVAAGGQHRRPESDGQEQFMGV